MFTVYDREVNRDCHCDCTQLSEKEKSLVCRLCGEGRVYTINRMGGGEKREWCHCRVVSSVCTNSPLHDINILTTVEAADVRCTTHLDCVSCLCQFVDNPKMFTFGELLPGVWGRPS